MVKVSKPRWVHVPVDVEVVAEFVGTDVVEHDERVDDPELVCWQGALASDPGNDSVDAVVAGDALDGSGRQGSGRHGSLL